MEKSEKNYLDTSWPFFDIPYLSILAKFTIGDFSISSKISNAENESSFLFRLEMDPSGMSLA